MNPFFLADVYRVTLALITLLYASYKDIKTREIPPILWLVASILAIPATAYEALVLISKGFLGYVLLSFLSCGAVVALLVYLMLRGMMGGADVFAMAFLTVDMPWYPFSFGARAVVPVPLLTLFYAAVLAAAWIPLKMLKNLFSKEFRKHAEELGIRGGDLLRFAASAKAVTVKEYMKMKFWFPLEMFEEKDGKLVRMLRKSFNVEEEHEEHQRRLKELVERGLLNEDSLIFVTYGIPFLVYITAGLILSLFLGDIPLRVLFGG